jgi:hypothetical protein
MSSHDQTDLKRIDHKLQRILDNAAVSRVDRVFSVLLTITIFVLGLLLNGILSVTGLVRAWTIGLLVLLSFTLIGEFDAMLRNSDKKRVAYWMTLLFGLFMAFSLFPIAALDFLGLELRIVLLIMTPIPFLYFGLIYWVDKVFTNFFNNLPTREFPNKAWNYFGRRIALGLMIFVGTVIVVTFFGI